MPAVTINGVAFDANVYDDESLLRMTFEARIVPEPITTILIGRDGTRNKMNYGTKYRFEYEWQKVPQATRAALWIARQQSGVFPIIHIDATTYNVQIESESDWSETVDHTTPDRARYYNITLIMHQP